MLYQTRRLRWFAAFVSLPLAVFPKSYCPAALLGGASRDACCTAPVAPAVEPSCPYCETAESPESPTSESQAPVPAGPLGECCCAARSDTVPSPAKPVALEEIYATLPAGTPLARPAKIAISARDTAALWHEHPPWRVLFCTWLL